MKIITTAILVFFLNASLYAGDIINKPSTSLDADNKYIFYLHGSAEEEEGETDKYTTTVEAIADSSATVITEVRGATDPNTYAQKIKAQVSDLISKGVPAENITVSGFSKGSIITLAVANIMNNPKINYVLLAGCSSELNEKYNVETNNLSGRILSIYDSGDEKFESCDGIITSSDKVKFEETDLDSGKGHKVFRIPKDKFINQWREPLIDWAGA